MVQKHAVRRLHCDFRLEGAAVATPPVWREVNGGLDPASFTIRTIPPRLARRTRDPWEGFEHDPARTLPALPETR